MGSMQRLPANGRSSKGNARGPLRGKLQAAYPALRRLVTQSTIKSIDWKSSLYDIDRARVRIDRRRSTDRLNRSIEIEIGAINRSDHIDQSIDFKPWPEPSIDSFGQRAAIASWPLTNSKSICCDNIKIEKFRRARYN